MEDVRASCTVQIKEPDLTADVQSVHSDSAVPHTHAGEELHAAHKAFEPTGHSETLRDRESIATALTLTTGHASLISSVEPEVKSHDTQVLSISESVAVAETDQHVVSRSEIKDLKYHSTEELKELEESTEVLDMAEESFQCDAGVVERLELPCSVTIRVDPHEALRCTDTVTVVRHFEKLHKHHSWAKSVAHTSHTRVTENTLNFSETLETLDDVKEEHADVHVVDRPDFEDNVSFTKVESKCEIEIAENTQVEQLVSSEDHAVKPHMVHRPVALETLEGKTWSLPLIFSEMHTEEPHGDEVVTGLPDSDQEVTASDTIVEFYNIAHEQLSPAVRKDTIIAHAGDEVIRDKAEELGLLIVFVRQYVAAVIRLAAELVADDLKDQAKPLSIEKYAELTEIREEPESSQSLDSISVEPEQLVPVSSLLKSHLILDSVLFNSIELEYMKIAHIDHALHATPSELHTPVDTTNEFHCPEVIEEHEWYEGPENLLTDMSPESVQPTQVSSHPERKSLKVHSLLDRLFGGIEFGGVELDYMASQAALSGHDEFHKANVTTADSSFAEIVTVEAFSPVVQPAESLLAIAYESKPSLHEEIEPDTLHQGTEHEISVPQESIEEMPMQTATQCTASVEEEVRNTNLENQLPLVESQAGETAHTPDEMMMSGSDFKNTFHTSEHVGTGEIREEPESSQSLEELPEHIADVKTMVSETEETERPTAKDYQCAEELKDPEFLEMETKLGSVLSSCSGNLVDVGESESEETVSEVSGPLAETALECVSSESTGVDDLESVSGVSPREETECPSELAALNFGDIALPEIPVVHVDVSVSGHPIAVSSSSLNTVEKLPYKTIFRTPVEEDITAEVICEETKAVWCAEEHAKDIHETHTENGTPTFEEDSIACKEEGGGHLLTHECEHSNILHCEEHHVEKDNSESWDEIPELDTLQCTANLDVIPDEITGPEDVRCASPLQFQCPEDVSEPEVSHFDSISVEPEQLVPVSSLLESHSILDSVLFNSIELEYMTVTHIDLTLDATPSELHTPVDTTNEFHCPEVIEEHEWYEGPENLLTDDVSPESVQPTQVSSHQERKSLEAGSPIDTLFGGIVFGEVELENTASQAHLPANDEFHKAKVTTADSSFAEIVTVEAFSPVVQPAESLLAIAHESTPDLHQEIEADILHQGIEHQTSVPQESIEEMQVQTATLCETSLEEEIGNANLENQLPLVESQAGETAHTPDEMMMSGPDFKNTTLHTCEHVETGSLGSRESLPEITDCQANDESTSFGSETKDLQFLEQEFRSTVEVKEFESDKEEIFSLHASSCSGFSMIVSELESEETKSDVSLPFTETPLECFSSESTGLDDLASFEDESFAWETTQSDEELSFACVTTTNSFLHKAESQDSLLEATECHTDELEYAESVRDLDEADSENIEPTRTEETAFTTVGSSDASQLLLETALENCNKDSVGLLALKSFEGENASETTQTGAQLGVVGVSVPLVTLHQETDSLTDLQEPAECFEIDDLVEDTEDLDLSDVVGMNIESTVTHSDDFSVPNIKSASPTLGSELQFEMDMSESSNLPSPKICSSQEGIEIEDLDATIAREELCTFVQLEKCDSDTCTDFDDETQRDSQVAEETCSVYEVVRTDELEFQCGEELKEMDEYMTMTESEDKSCSVTETTSFENLSINTMEPKVEFQCYVDQVDIEEVEEQAESQPDIEEGCSPSDAADIEVASATQAPTDLSFCPELCEDIQAQNIDMTGSQIDEHFEATEEAEKEMDILDDVRTPFIHTQTNTTEVSFENTEDLDIQVECSSQISGSDVEVSNLDVVDTISASCMLASEQQLDTDMSECSSTQSSECSFNQGVMQIEGELETTETWERESTFVQLQKCDSPTSSYTNIENSMLEDSQTADVTCSVQEVAGAEKLAFQSGAEFIEVDEYATLAEPDFGSCSVGFTLSSEDLSTMTREPKVHFQCHVDHMSIEEVEEQSESQIEIKHGTSLSEIVDSLTASAAPRPHEQSFCPELCEDIQTESIDHVRSEYDEQYEASGATEKDLDKLDHVSKPSILTQTDVSEVPPEQTEDLDIQEDNSNHVSSSDVEPSDITNVHINDASCVLVSEQHLDTHTSEYSSARSLEICNSQEMMETEECIPDFEIEAAFCESRELDDTADVSKADAMTNQPLECAVVRAEETELTDDIADAKHSHHSLDETSTGPQEFGSAGGEECVVLFSAESETKTDGLSEITDTSFCRGVSFQCSPREDSVVKEQLLEETPTPRTSESSMSLEFAQEHATEPQETEPTEDVVSVDCQWDAVEDSEFHVSREHNEDVPVCAGVEVLGSVEETEAEDLDSEEPHSCASSLIMEHETVSAPQAGSMLCAESFLTEDHETTGAAPDSPGHMNLEVTVAGLDQAEMAVDSTEPWSCGGTVVEEQAETTAEATNVEAIPCEMESNEEPETQVFSQETTSACLASPETALVQEIEMSEDTSDVEMVSCDWESHDTTTDNAAVHEMEGLQSSELCWRDDPGTVESVPDVQSVIGELTSTEKLTENAPIPSIPAQKANESCIDQESECTEEMPDVDFSVSEPVETQALEASSMEIESQFCPESDLREVEETMDDLEDTELADSVVGFTEMADKTGSVSITEMFSSEHKTHDFDIEDIPDVKVEDSESTLVGELDKATVDAAQTLRTPETHILPDQTRDLPEKTFLEANESQVQETEFLEAEATDLTPLVDDHCLEVKHGFLNELILTSSSSVLDQVERTQQFASVKSDDDPYELTPFQIEHCFSGTAFPRMCSDSDLITRQGTRRVVFAGESLSLPSFKSASLTVLSALASFEASARGEQSRYFEQSIRGGSFQYAFKTPELMSLLSGERAISNLSVNEGVDLSGVNQLITNYEELRREVSIYQKLKIASIWMNEEAADEFGESTQRLEEEMLALIQQISKEGMEPDKSLEQMTDVKQDSLFTGERVESDFPRKDPSDVSLEDSPESLEAELTVVDNEATESLPPARLDEQFTGEQHCDLFSSFSECEVTETWDLHDVDISGDMEPDRNEQMSEVKQDSLFTGENIESDVPWKALEDSPESLEAELTEVDNEATESLVQENAGQHFTGEQQSDLFSSSDCEVTKTWDLHDVDMAGETEAELQDSFLFFITEKALPEQTAEVEVIETSEDEIVEPEKVKQETVSDTMPPAEPTQTNVGSVEEVTEAEPHDTVSGIQDLESVQGDLKQISKTESVAADFAEAQATPDVKEDLGETAEITSKPSEIPPSVTGSHKRSDTELAASESDSTRLQDFKTSESSASESESFGSVASDFPEPEEEPQEDHREDSQIVIKLSELSSSISASSRPLETESAASNLPFPAKEPEEDLKQESSILIKPSVLSPSVSGTSMSPETGSVASVVPFPAKEPEEDLKQESSILIKPSKLSPSVSGTSMTLETGSVTSVLPEPEEDIRQESGILIKPSVLSPSVSGTSMTLETGSVASVLPEEDPEEDIRQDSDILTTPSEVSLIINAPSRPLETESFAPDATGEFVLKKDFPSDFQIIMEPSELCQTVSAPCKRLATEMAADVTMDTLHYVSVDSSQNVTVETCEQTGITLTERIVDAEPCPHTEPCDRIPLLEAPEYIGIEQLEKINVDYCGQVSVEAAEQITAQGVEVKTYEEELHVLKQKACMCIAPYTEAHAVVPCELASSLECQDSATVQKTKGISRQSWLDGADSQQDMLAPGIEGWTQVPDETAAKPSGGEPCVFCAHGKRNQSDIGKQTSGDFVDSHSWIGLEKTGKYQHFVQGVVQYPECLLEQSDVLTMSMHHVSVEEGAEACAERPDGAVTQLSAIDLEELTSYVVIDLCEPGILRMLEYDAPEQGVEQDISKSTEGRIIAVSEKAEAHSDDGVTFDRDVFPDRTEGCRECREVLTETLEPCGTSAFGSLLSKNGFRQSDETSRPPDFTTGPVSFQSNKSQGPVHYIETSVQLAYASNDQSTLQPWIGTEQNCLRQGTCTKLTPDTAETHDASITFSADTVVSGLQSRFKVTAIENSVTDPREESSSSEENEGNISDTNVEVQLTESSSETSVQWGSKDSEQSEEDVSGQIHSKENGEENEVSTVSSQDSGLTTSDFEEAPTRSNPRLYFGSQRADIDGRKQKHLEFLNVFSDDDSAGQVGDMKSVTIAPTEPFDTLAIPPDPHLQSTRQHQSKMSDTQVKSSEKLSNSDSVEKDKIQQVKLLFDASSKTSLPAKKPSELSELINSVSTFLTEQHSQEEAGSILFRPTKHLPLDKKLPKHTRNAVVPQDGSEKKGDRLDIESAEKEVTNQNLRDRFSITTELTEEPARKSEHSMTSISEQSSDSFLKESSSISHSGTTKLLEDKDSRIVHRNRIQKSITAHHKRDVGFRAATEDQSMKSDRYKPQTMSFLKSSQEIDPQSVLHRNQALEEAAWSKPVNIDSSMIEHDPQVFSMEYTNVPGTPEALHSQTRSPPFLGESLFDKSTSTPQPSTYQDVNFTGLQAQLDSSVFYEAKPKFTNNGKNDTLKQSPGPDEKKVSFNQLGDLSDSAQQHESHNLSTKDNKVPLTSKALDSRIEFSAVLEQPSKSTDSFNPHPPSQTESLSTICSKDSSDEVSTCVKENIKSHTITIIPTEPLINGSAKVSSVEKHDSKESLVYGKVHQSRDLSHLSTPPTQKLSERSEVVSHVSTHATKQHSQKEASSVVFKPTSRHLPSDEKLSKQALTATGYGFVDGLERNTGKIKTESADKDPTTEKMAGANLLNRFSISAETKQEISTTTKENISTSVSASEQSVDSFLEESETISDFGAKKLLRKKDSRIVHRKRIQQSVSPHLGSSARTLQTERDVSIDSVEVEKRQKKPNLSDLNEPKEIFFLKPSQEIGQQTTPRQKHLSQKGAEVAGTPDALHTEAGELRFSGESSLDGGRFKPQNLQHDSYSTGLHSRFDSFVFHEPSNSTNSWKDATRDQSPKKKKVVFNEPGDLSSTALQQGSHLTSWKSAESPESRQMLRPAVRAAGQPFLDGGSAVHRVSTLQDFNSTGLNLSFAGAKDQHHYESSWKDSTITPRVGLSTHQNGLSFSQRSRVQAPHIQDHSAVQEPVDWGRTIRADELDMWRAARRPHVSQRPRERVHCVRSCEAPLQPVYQNPVPPADLRWNSVVPGTTPAPVQIAAPPMQSDASDGVASALGSVPVSFNATISRVSPTITITQPSPFPLHGAPAVTDAAASLHSASLQHAPSRMSDRVSRVRPAGPLHPTSPVGPTPLLQTRSDDGAPFRPDWFPNSGGARCAELSSHRPRVQAVSAGAFGNAPTLDLASNRFAVPHGPRHQAAALDSASESQRGMELTRQDSTWPPGDAVGRRALGVAKSNWLLEHHIRNSTADSRTFPLRHHQQSLGTSAVASPDWRILREYRNDFATHAQLNRSSSKSWHHLQHSSHCHPHAYVNYSTLEDAKRALKMARASFSVKPPSLSWRIKNSRFAQDNLRVTKAGEFCRNSHRTCHKNTKR